METLTLALISFLSGGTILALVNWLIGRRKSRLEVSGMQDDHTKKWRDDALHLSEEILEKENERHTLSMQLHECLRARKNCQSCGTE